MNTDAHLEYWDGSEREGMLGVIVAHLKGELRSERRAAKAKEERAIAERERAKELRAALKQKLRAAECKLRGSENSDGVSSFREGSLPFVARSALPMSAPINCAPV